MRHHRPLYASCRSRCGQPGSIASGTELVDCDVCQRLLRQTAARMIAEQEADPGVLQALQDCLEGPSGIILRALVEMSEGPGYRGPLVPGVKISGGPNLFAGDTGEIPPEISEFAEGVIRRMQEHDAWYASLNDEERATEDKRRVRGAVNFVLHGPGGS